MKKKTLVLILQIFSFVIFAVSMLRFQKKRELMELAVVKPFLQCGVNCFKNMYPRMHRVQFDLVKEDLNLIGREFLYSV